MATDTSASKQPTYINNPFYIAANGIQLFIAKALGVAVLLIIVSAFLAPNPASYTAPTAPLYGELEKTVSEQSTTDNGNVAPSPATPEAIASPAEAAVLAIIPPFIIIVALMVANLLSGIAGYTATRLIHNKSVTFKEALRAAWDNFGGLLWLNVLMTLKVLAWSLLFVIPGIVMAYRYSLANISYFDKQLRGNAAIKDSANLTKGSWITTFGGQSMFNFITFGILSPLVMASSTAVLYRQFNATPLEKRPKTHKLSIATLVVSIILAIVVLTFMVSLAYQVIQLISDLNGTM